MSTEPCDDRGAIGPRRRITLTSRGPTLVPGPVEVVTETGAVVRCDRFLVALCTCHRSGIYPLCDTSHRRHRGKDDEN